MCSVSLKICHKSRFLIAGDKLTEKNSRNPFENSPPNRGNQIGSISHSDHLKEQLLLLLLDANEESHHPAQSQSKLGPPLLFVCRKHVRVLDSSHVLASFLASTSPPPPPPLQNGFISMARPGHKLPPPAGELKSVLWCAPCKNIPHHKCMSGAAATLAKELRHVVVRSSFRV